MTHWIGKSIVVVEDHHETRQNLVALYEDIGLKVLSSVSGGVEGAKVACEKCPDFVSMDIIMPDMDGIECCLKILDSGIKSHVFFVSALSCEPRVVQAYADTISSERFLEKPLTKENITNYLDNLGRLNEASAPEASQASTSASGHQVPPLPSQD